MQQSGEKSPTMDVIEDNPGGIALPSSRSNRDEFFDASQYAFFGGNVSEEVELGGLDEDDGGEQLEDGEDSLDALAERDGLSESEASPAWDSVSDLTSSFAKLNSTSPSREEVARSGLDERRQFLTGRDAPAPLERSFEGGPAPNWLDRPVMEKEIEAGARKWWPNHQHQSVQGVDFDGVPLGPPVHQQSGHTQAQQQQRWWGNDPSLAHLSPPNALAGSFPPSRQPHQRSATPPGPQSGQYRQTMAAPPAVPHLGGGVIPSHMVYGPGQSPFTSTGHMLPPAQSQNGPWAQRPAGSAVPGNSVPQQMPLMPPQVMLQYPRQQAPLHSSPPLPYTQMPYGSSPPPGPDHLMQKINETGMPREFWDQRDQRFDPQFRPRQTHHRFHQQNLPSDGSHGGRGGPNGWHQFRSKYMTADEIENIVRIQWAATHGSDPYIDDYYHQAVQAKLAGGTPHGRRHFAPSHPRDMPSHARAAAEPHAFLQVDALGRVPYSSIRRPRPLLEVDSARSDGMNMGDHINGDLGVEGMSPQRPLEQEPMLAARIAIEDGLCLLLDVDDIDRLLAVQQHPDGGAQLRRRRQILLEGLASSLQLTDPLGNSADLGNRINGRFVGLNPKDDLVFLRLVSLPKGKKLLTRYLQLLNLGSELVQIVCMAVSRHLRFLFNGPQSDAGAAATTAALANSVALAVLSMDLPSLSGCLLSVVLASETTPLRPMGAPAGDGATVILRNILERATMVRRDRHAFHTPQSLTIWQHAFDAFFSILTKYCTNKYDSVIHSLMMLYPGNIPAINAAADEALKKEIPVELLQATLPHTSEQQRKLLYDLITNRAGAMSGIPSQGANSADSHASNTATVRG